MQRKNFKRVGDKLAFNTTQGEPIFVILQEIDKGYLYFLESSPFGQVNFVHKHLVVDDRETVEEEKPARERK